MEPDIEDWIFCLEKDAGCSQVFEFQLGCV